MAVSNTMLAAILLALLVAEVASRSLDVTPGDAPPIAAASRRAWDHGRFKRADKDETLAAESSYGIGFYPGGFGYGYGYPYGYGYGYGYPYYGFGSRFYGYGGYGYGYPYWW